jgi:hypothetical protein
MHKLSPSATKIQDVGVRQNMLATLASVISSAISNGEIALEKVPTPKNKKASVTSTKPYTRTRRLRIRTTNTSLLQQLLKQNGFPGHDQIELVFSAQFWG